MRNRKESFLFFSFFFFVNTWWRKMITWIWLNRSNTSKPKWRKKCTAKKLFGLDFSSRGRRGPSPESGPNHGRLGSKRMIVKAVIFPKCHVFLKEQWETSSVWLDRTALPTRMICLNYFFKEKEVRKEICYYSLER